MNLVLSASVLFILLGFYFLVMQKYFCGFLFLVISIVFILLEYSKNILEYLSFHKKEKLKKSIESKEYYANSYEKMGGYGLIIADSLRKEAKVKKELLNS